MIPQGLPVRHRTGSYRERRSLTRLGTPPVGGVPPNPVTFSAACQDPSTRQSALG